jgi:hypothetical protein
MSTNQEGSTSKDAPANEDGLRRFCARILGWAEQRTDVVEHAIRSIELAMDHCAALVLLGDDDLVPIAHALHRRMLGAEQPFIVADRRRGNRSASVRSPASHVNGIAALQSARGGSLCVRAQRLPNDFSSMVAQVRHAMVTLTRAPEDFVHFIVCADGRYDTHPFLVLPAPIRVPSLATRASELSRIVDEYAFDALAELGAPDTCFTEADHRWFLEHSPRTLGEIEKATLRIVALRMSRNLSNAAERLGMAPVSLTRWIRRRKLSLILGDLELAPVLADDGALLAAEEEIVLDRDLDASITVAEAGCEPGR